MRKKGIYKLVLAALFLALGMVLPLLTGQLKEIGDSLLPMHLAVMLCGVICGWEYGLSVGLCMPFLRSVSFGMPPIYPNAVWMALELATYGLVIGLFYSRRKGVHRGYIFFCLAVSMVAGRIVWGIAKAVLLGVAGKPFGLKAFLVGGFLDAIPGILLQFVLVPLIVALAERFVSQRNAT
ncbi:MAG: ECF transporter S component [Clostridia bacterium]|nr:ECF transporter S component [Clostridia bacterium]